MVKSVFKELEKIWYPKENIFSEWFTPSWRNDSILKEIFINWNIPFVKGISWWIIWLAIILAGTLFFRTWEDSLYENFLFFWPFQNFIFNILWFAVAFVMIIRPLSDIFYENKFLRKLKNFRQAFWILSSLLIVAWFMSEWIFNPNSFITYFSNTKKWGSFEALIARISEVTAFFLLITSNRFSQKFLWKWWKIIQYLSYPYFITWALNAVVNWGSSQIQYYWILWIWIVLWIIAFILNFKRIKKENSN